MISAVIYSSETGSCEKYAFRLSAKLHIPAYNVKNIAGPLGREVIYVGWLMAGNVMGLKRVMKDFKVRAVVQVGMAAPTDASEKVCREKNNLPDDIKVFTLQGRFNLYGLPLPFRMIMTLMNKNIAKRLHAKAAKAGLSPEESACLKMAETGMGEPASWDGILEVIDWAFRDSDPADVKRWKEY